jgi:hypothetical protein
VEVGHLLILSDLAPLQNAHQSRGVLAICTCQPQREVRASLGNRVYFCMIVNEVATSAVLTGKVFAEMLAFLGLVLHVSLIILQ